MCINSLNVAEKFEREMAWENVLLYFLELLIELRLPLSKIILIKNTANFVTT